MLLATNYFKCCHGCGSLQEIDSPAFCPRCLGVTTYYAPRGLSLDEQIRASDGRWADRAMEDLREGFEVA